MSRKTLGIAAFALCTVLVSSVLYAQNVQNLYTWVEGINTDREADAYNVKPEEWIDVEVGEDATVVRRLRAAGANVRFVQAYARATPRWHSGCGTAERWRSGSRASTRRGHAAATARTASCSDRPSTSRP